MSLHTAWMLMLVVVTLGCGGKPETGRDEAIAAVDEVGGKVQCDRAGSVAIVNLEHTQITDAGLEHLKGLTSLQELHLCFTQVTDASLEHLKGLTDLEWLEMYDTQVTDAGVNELKKAVPRCTIRH